MSALSSHLQEYLRLRRSLGFKLAAQGRALARFVEHLDATDTAAITTADSIAWAALPTGVDPVTHAHRLTAIRGFARYLAAIDPATEIPPENVFPGQGKRPTPHLFTPDEINTLIEAAGGLRPPLRAATYQTLIGLLAVTGIRISEAFHLTTADIDWHEGVMTVTGAKNGARRLLPLHTDVLEALSRYRAVRDRSFPTPRTGAFFLSTHGTTLCYSPVNTTFVELTTALGMRTAHVRPRIHDLRHGFAVATLLDWYRNGDDVAACMPVLSTWLGHINPAGTYWYLSATPELMALAAARLQTTDRQV
jgi:integrase